MVGLTLHDTRFVECRWWNDGWTVKTVVNWRSSASMMPAPNPQGSYLLSYIPYQIHSREATRISSLWDAHRKIEPPTLHHAGQRAQHTTVPKHTPIALSASRQHGVSVSPITAVCLLFVACLMSQQHASITQGRIWSDNFTCCHTGIEVADHTFYVTQSQYTDTGPTSPNRWPYNARRLAG